MANSLSLEQYQLIIVMGVSGCGKSTIAKELASVLELPFIEGDELHPKHNVDKMSRGEPLTDCDREPWLKLIRKRSKEECDQQWEEYVKERVQKETGAGMSGGDDVEGNQKKRKGGFLRGVVVSCSALKKSYRDTLRGLDYPSEAMHPDAPLKLSAPPPYVMQTTFVFPNGPKEVLDERMSNRQGHFMKSKMLESQLDTLEDPTQTEEDGVIEVDIRMETERQVEEILRVLRSRFGNYLDL